MILYANGCSHTAAAEAVVPYCFAEDDGNLPNNWLLGRVPHPDNLAASWCTHVARGLGYELVCDAESASSNDRIFRTTHQWLDRNQDSWSKVFMIIQCTTWEREEWLHDGIWYQVNASGIDSVPAELEQRYRDYILNIDYQAKTVQAHEQFWNLHRLLQDRGICHLFYNSWSTFSDIPPDQQQDWGTNYMAPYDRSGSYSAVLRQKGCQYSKGYHFGADGHRLWAEHVLQYINANNLT
jgi:hypothetical protein